jgi:hypothetical protein
MEVLIFTGLVSLSVIGLLALDRDGLRRLDTEEIFEDDEYFIDQP